MTQLISSLKENNDILTSTFNQYKQHAQQQIAQLEERLAQMSVEKAEREMNLDVAASSLYA